MTVRVLIADDHPIMLAAIGEMLRQAGGFQVEGEAVSPEGLFSMLENVACELLISDLNMEGGDVADGIQMIQRIGRLRPDLPIIVVTQTGGQPILQSLAQNAVAGIIHKTDALTELLPAVAAVLRGERYRSRRVQAQLAAAEDDHAGRRAELSDREADVLRLLAAGLTVREIAAKLNRSVQTVSEHKANAMAKLGLSSDLELYEYGREHHLTR